MIFIYNRAVCQKLSIDNETDVGMHSSSYYNYVKTKTEKKLLKCMSSK